MINLIKIATIGTSNITKEFLESAKKNPYIKVVCCYSRNILKAKEFIIDNNLSTAKAVDSFTTIVNEVDAVYIASPNGLHYEQSKYFLSQQKHVFVEKPITFTYNEALELTQIAQMNNVILMEAYKTIHVPQFEHLNDFVTNYSPFLATFSMNQYSSRMEKVKMGDYSSVFDYKLGKGSTYDMLVYPVEMAIALFGPVKEVKAMGQKLPNKSGLTDVVILRHETDVLVNIMCSKAAHGRVWSEIMSEDGTLYFESCTRLNNIKLYDFNSDLNSVLFEANDQKPFDYELSVFVSMIQKNNFVLRDYLLQISCESVRVLNLVEKNQEEIGEN